jgi:hypothetical protein
MLISSHLNKYKQTILELPEDKMLSKAELLASDLLMKRSGLLEMYYAPHNEYVNPAAKVVIIGITPGWTQMRIALQAAKAGLKAGLSDETVCRLAKEAAGFAGTMRTHLIDMLDALELHRYLGAGSCGDLFRDQHELLHTTSLLRFPVFVAGNNYNGTHPPLLTNPFLNQTVLRSLQDELSLMNQPLIIPLGKNVEQVLQRLVADGMLDARDCLWGFPHPSGANGHRHKQFASHQESMRNKIRALSGK